jgi:hypothetical protein
MPAVQKNFQYFTYTDDNGAAWNKLGWLDSAVNAVDGSTALTAGARVFPHSTRRYHPRQVVWRDPTTFRTVRTTIYTSAAFAAITSATTLAVNVPGLATTVPYTAKLKIAEKQPLAASTRQLADHP